MDQYYYLWILSEQLNIPLDVIRWEIFKIMGLEMIFEYTKDCTLDDALDYYCADDDYVNFVFCLRYISKKEGIPIIDIIDNEDGKTDDSLQLLYTSMYNSPTIFKWLYNIVDDCHINDCLLNELFYMGDLDIIKYLYKHHFDENIENFINKKQMILCCDREECVEWLYSILNWKKFKHICSFIDDYQ